MQRIESESERMRQLVEDLLTLARLDDAAPARREHVDLVVMVADTLSDVATLDTSRRLSLHAPAPVVVDAVPGHVRQAVTNLIVNAVHHTPPGTAIEVAVTDRGGRARLVVRDHGPGLDDAALDHAFERFWQANASRAGAGTGLGLSIVHAIASEHGGSVSVVNHPDGGAEFTLDLPLPATPTVPTPPTPSPPEPSDAR